MKQFTGKKTLLFILITVICFQNPVWADVTLPYLPDDVLHKILQNLNEKDRSAVSCVCTEWKKISTLAQEHARENFEKQHGNILKPLLERIKTLREEHKEQESPQVTLDHQLISAVSKQDFAAVLGLIFLGANVHALHGFLGSSPLMAAARKGNLDIFNTLLEHNPNVNVVSIRSKDTALICAARKGCLDMVKALLKRDANVNAVSSEGNTALILAARKGRLDIVKALLEHNPDFTVSNDCGMTALSSARFSGHPEIVEALETAGAKE